MEPKDIIIQQPEETPMVIQPMDLAQAQKSLENLQRFVRSQLHDGRDFGIIPGCKKPSLWKSGAERLLFFHGLACRLDTTSETVVDWKTPFFNYCYRATIYNPRNNAVVATADGSCNSKEDKYRYLWVTEKKLPKGINKDNLESKEISGSNGKFTLYRIDNDSIFGLANTILKMASKRAFIAATLMACRASDVFTQDESEEEAAAPAEKPKAEAPKTAPAAKAPQESKSDSPAEEPNTVYFVPDKVSEKKGLGPKGPWIKFGLLGPDGSWYGTFNEEYGSNAKSAKDQKQQVKVVFEVSDKGFKNITSLEVLA